MPLMAVSSERLSLLTAAVIDAVTTSSPLVGSVRPAKPSSVATAIPPGVPLALSSSYWMTT